LPYFPGSDRSDGKNDDKSAFGNSYDVITVLKKKQKSNLTTAAILNEELDADESDLQLYDKNSKHRMNDELLFKNEPELRDDIFEDTIKNSFGEDVPMLLSKEKQLDDSIEPLLPSEQQEVSIKLLHRLIKNSTSYEEVLKIHAENRTTFFIEHYDSLTRMLIDFLIKGLVYA